MREFTFGRIKNPDKLDASLEAVPAIIDMMLLISEKALLSSEAINHGWFGPGSVRSNMLNFACLLERGQAII